jgi:hypothetical protein
MVLSLYCYNPPRRNKDYQLMKVVAAEPKTDKFNYLVWRETPRRFVFNQFKTARKEGQVVVEIPEDLQRIIELYFRHHPIIKGRAITKKTPEFDFLVFYDGSPLNTTNSITRILNKVFDKKVGSSMLRHIYLSDKYGEELEEKKDDAAKMSHSLDTQQKYIKTKS